MGEQVELQKLLLTIYSEKQKKNRAFSLRAFARQVGISPTSLSQFLSGKRRLSIKLATNIVKNLTLSPSRADAVLKTISNGKNQYKSTYTQIDMDQYHSIADWYHFAILSLLRTSDFQNDPEWIAKRLNIKLREAKSGLERLIRLGIIEETSEGKIKPTHNQVITSDDISSISLRKSHFQCLELAQRSLEQDEITLRDFTSITMAIDPDKIAEAKTKIRNFYNELSQTLETGNRREVYIFFGQLFPLTIRSEVK